MPVVRSQRLIAFVAAADGANSPAWLTPQGFTTLVKSIVASNGTATASDIVVVISTAGGASLGAFRRNVPATTVIELETWFVLNPGDSMYANISHQGAGVWISGSVLSGEPTLPPASLTVNQVEQLQQRPSQMPA